MATIFSSRLPGWCPGFGAPVVPLTYAIDLYLAPPLAFIFMYKGAEQC